MQMDDYMDELMGEGEHLMIMQSTNEAKYSIPPKYFTIAEQLRTRIKSGIYGEKLPSEREISDHFGVNNKTLKKAITMLAQEGLIYSKHGSGTYVTSPVGAPPALIGCLMMAHGHLYERFSRELAICLQRRGFIPAIIDTGDESFSEVGSLNLSRLLTINPHGMVVSGNNPQLLNMLMQYEYRQRVQNLILVLGLSQPPPDWATCVLSDACHGKYLATRYLLEQGRKKILFVSSDKPAQTDIDYQESPYNQFLEGYRQGLKESGLENHEKIVFEGDIVSDATLLKRLVKNGITGILAHNDASAARIIRRLNDGGISVPGDVTVVGYYDTPWAHNTELPFPTISIRENEIASICAEKVIQNCAKPEVIKVRPELVLCTQ
jgi:GntR family transcriptional regulator of arabinose operon